MWWWIRPTRGTATGDNGVYDVVPRTVTLTGHVVLTKQKNVMRGTQMTVNLVTGQMALTAGGAKLRPANPAAACRAFSRPPRHSRAPGSAILGFLKHKQA